ncbi:MAG: hypothetical protein ACOVOD_10115, partial [Rhodoferax sp.]
MNKSQVVSREMLVLLSLALSIAWLLPNHTPPWTAFHSEAWASIIITIVSAICLFNSKRIAIGHASLFIGLLAFIPFFQYLTGQIHFFGIAWMSGLYLFGLMMAIVIGENWEKNSAGQCGNFLFLAILNAATISVFIQIAQLNEIQGLDPWVLNIVSEGRYYANLAQPNQLGSLLILALIAVSLFWNTGKYSTTFAVIHSVFIIFGVYLTGSRTAYLNLAILALAVFVYRAKFQSKIFVALAAFVGFLAALYLVVWPALVALGVDTSKTTGFAIAAV